MKERSYNTISANDAMVHGDRKWVVIDAEGLVLGRLCSQIAHLLRGKHKPLYTPNTDCGDYVIVINAEKVRFTGKKWAQKEYKNYSGFPGGLRLTPAKEMLVRNPIAPIEHGVKGMLPHTKLGDAMYTKLFVYAGAEHPHAAQQPETITVKL